MNIGLIVGFIFIPLSFLVSGIFYKKFPDVKQDNAIEEIVEEVIKKETGVDVDISPDSPEKGSKDGNQ